MILSHDFVWAHIPKTGGDATATMLERVPRLIELADPHDDHIKHSALERRAELIAGKTLVANMRRLPAWALSYMRHRQHHGLPPDYTPQGPRPADVVAAESAADAWLDEIIGGYTVDVWIRQERLVEDLVAFLRARADLAAQEETAVRSVGRLNVDRTSRWSRSSPSRFFSRSQIKALYANNPRWAEIERSVYG
jgi:hypothetical protein